jgi:HSP20 family molecular chaperone IbpA
MARDTRSFFEKLTGAIKMDNTSHFDDVDEDKEEDYSPAVQPSMNTGIQKKIQPVSPTANQATSNWLEDETEEEGELTVDVYQNDNEIVVKTMVAGVKPEDLDITITRDMVTIKGKRETEKSIADEDYFHQELYWGSFSRTVMLPAEIDVEESEAVEKHGLLIIRMPKIDRHKQARLKVKG